jgi:hypothetical protein
MKKIVTAAFTTAAALALAGCNGAGTETDEAAMESSETMAEEAVGDEAMPAGEATEETAADAPAVTEEAPAE